MMVTAKEEVQKMLDELPEDVSFDEIQYHLYVRQKVERGLKDVTEGQVIPQDDAQRRMNKWLEP